MCRKNKIAWIIIFLLLNSRPLYCQGDDLYSLIAIPRHGWIKSETLESITLPTSLKRNTEIEECFSDNSYLSSCHGCISILGFSHDEEFAVLMFGPEYTTIQDSIDFVNLLPKLQVITKLVGAEAPTRTVSGPNTQHLATLYGNLRYTLAKDTLIGWDIEENVHYYPQEYARAKFNADSAATYHSWPYYAKPYRDKYIGSQALMLMKRDKGYVFLYCFYTENSKTRVEEFMKELDGIVWFKD